MSAEPQRDIESDLRAYKRHREGQLGAPLELHPATRKLLQGEVARAASRPLLTSEEAAKNFVRSFVMSHQQPGFFARFRPQILWGGGMFACLAVVLLVLRHDPQQRAREQTFPDALPPAPTLPPATVPASGQVRVETEKLSRVKGTAPAEAELMKFSATPVAGPVPVERREGDARRGGAAGAPLPAPVAITASGPAARDALLTAGRPTTHNESLGGGRALVREAERKLAEKPVQAEALAVAPLAKALKTAESAESGARKKDQADKEATVTTPGLQLKSFDEQKHGQTLARTSAGGFGGDTQRLAGTVSPAVAPGATPATAALAYAAAATAEAAQAQHRFRQLDNLAGYRRNFNSPPVPQVMQDFNFERNGDRVRITDADGSTYEGSVLPAHLEELRAQPTATQSQSAAATAAYRFQVSGMNRKLNQTVQFNGEWQPAAPVAAQPGSVIAPAFQTSNLGVQLDRAAVEQQSASAAKNLAAQSAQREAAPGRISGRATVGGRSEFEVNAVPK